MLLQACILLLRPCDLGFEKLSFCRSGRLILFEGERVRNSGQYWGGGEWTYNGCVKKRERIRRLCQQLVDIEEGAFGDLGPPREVVDFRLIRWSGKRRNRASVGKCCASRGGSSPGRTLQERLERRSFLLVRDLLELCGRSRESVWPRMCELRRFIWTCLVSSPRAPSVRRGSPSGCRQSPDLVDRVCAAGRAEQSLFPGASEASTRCGVNVGMLVDGNGGAARTFPGRKRRRKGAVRHEEGFSAHPALARREDRGKSRSPRLAGLTYITSTFNNTDARHRCEYGICIATAG